ncbi:hypothetical protein ADL12_47320 [Streptomyces regalis]|uniref:Uncharacterized protein n=1 Tax=Streptomyces regalis TaxID=68262 RepID=A0A117MJM7_9ACTN|nr:hypothetical protein ADL12_47320 [Streptomyces regalis]
MIGIAIPLLGTVATLLTVLSNNSDDDSGAGGAISSPATQQNSPAASGTPVEEPGGQNGASAAPTASVRFGPGDLVVNSTYGASGYVDLDSVPLLVTGRSTDGSDLAFDPTGSEPVDVEGQIAPLPAGASEPSEAECVTQLQKNELSELDLARDVAFCVQTGEGRTAYLRVISAPVEGEGKVRLKATVWDLPQ